MTRLWNAIAGWFLGPQDMAGMIVARVLLGGGLVMAYLLRASEIGLLYGSNAVAWFAPFRTFIADRGDFPLAPLAASATHLGEALIPIVVWGMFGALLLTSLCFAFGYRTRLSGCATLLLHLFFVSLVPLSYWGWSQMIVPFLLYTIVAPSGQWFSMDARRSGAPAGPPRGPGFPVRLMQIHVCTMYAQAGFARIDDPEWQRGEMLYGALVNTEFTRLAIPWETVQPLLTVLCLGVFVLEPAAPFLLWPRWTRRWTVYALIAMHIGLEVSTRVGLWNGVMIAGLCTFLPNSTFPRVISAPRPEAATDPAAP